MLPSFCNCARRWAWSSSAWDPPLRLAARRAATSGPGAAAQERISKAVYVLMQDPHSGATGLQKGSIRCAAHAAICKQLQLLQDAMMCFSQDFQQRSPALHLSLAPCFDVQAVATGICVCYMLADGRKLLLSNVATFTKPSYAEIQSD